MLLRRRLVFNFTFRLTVNRPLILTTLVNRTYTPGFIRCVSKGLTNLFIQLHSLSKRSKTKQTQIQLVHRHQHICTRFLERLQEFGDPRMNHLETESLDGGVNRPSLRLEEPIWSRLSTLSYWQVKTDVCTRLTGRTRWELSCIICL